MFRFIKQLIGSDFEAPFQEKKPREVKEIVPTPKNQQIDKRGNVCEVTKHESGFTWNYDIKVHGRTSEITEADKIEIKYRRLDIVKYKRIKYYWSRGLTAPETAKQFKDEDKCKQRTIETYYSAFNNVKRTT